MIQLVILGLAVLCLIAGVMTLAKGTISLTKQSKLEGPVARGAGLGLIGLAAALAAFALFVLPRL
jgi:hypothetical protein